MAIRPVDLSVTNITPTSVRLNWVAGALNPLQALINSLFGSAEQGAIYIPMPVVLGAQALFQDAAGTVPVTADGDPVGRMLDQSGNGNHATQSVSGTRSVYRTDGTLHWLQPDGVDDSFLYPASTTSTSHAMSIAHSPDSNIGSRVYLLDSNGSGRFILGHLALNSGKVGFYDGAWNEPGSATLGAQVVTYDANSVTTDAGIYRNSVLVGSRLPYSPRAISPPSKLFSVFEDEGSYYKGEVYGIVVIHNTLSESKRILLESYLAGLAGLTL